VYINKLKNQGYGKLNVGGDQSQSTFV